ncbi:hypothetical protein BC826DRAFT_1023373 [Russula brevipes]|nr:hypothetical protein BC826DRAFT_1023373 [Russula brevipes]
MFGEMSESTDDLHLYLNLHLLCIPQDTVLSYIEAHASNTETVVVPWKTWGPGNTRLIKVSDGMLKRNQLVCGMLALTGQSESFCQGDSLRIMDYHPRRVARILATQNMNSPGEVYIGEGPKSSNTTVKQRSSTYTSRDKELLYALKEIILPNGIESDRRYHYALGEDVVVLFEVCIYPFITRHSTSNTPPVCCG